MANSDWIVQLEAVIDNSSLTNTQKKIAKEHFKADLDIQLDIDKFANQKKRISKSVNGLASEMKTAFSNIGIGLSDKQATAFAREFLGNIKQATKEQEKLNQAQKKSSLATQTKYYQRIIDNNKTIYSLKEKLLTADKKQEAEIQRQITLLEKRNQYNASQLSKKGLTDNSWEWEVNSSKEVLENRLRINQEKQKDAALSKQITDVDRIQLSMSGEGSGKSYSFEVTELIQKYKNLGLTQKEAEAKVKELSDAHNNLNTILNQNVSVYSSLEAKNKAIIEADKKRTLALNKANNEYKEMALTAPKILTDIQRLNKVESIQKWADNNSKAVKRYGDDIKRIIERFAQLKVQMNSVEGDKLVAEFKQIQEAARKTGNIGMTAIDKFTTAWEKFGGWTLASSSLMRLWQEGKEGIQFITELDDALTDVAYTSDVSKAQLENLGNSAIEMAKDLNTSAKNVLEAVKIYSTANATAEDILRKAKPAIMLSNVSGMSGSESSKTINTALNQFEIEDTEENLLDIVDTLQYVSSQLNYDFTDAIKEITEGIEASGSVAKNAGLNMQEYATMVGLAVERTGQSGSTIGNAYKTIFSRITAASATEGTLDEDISKAEASLRAIGVQVRDSENDFRDLSYSMADIGKVWGDLTDIQKAKVGYDVAGIRQLNVLNSLFGSWEQYSSIMKDINDRTGISLKNQEEYADSLKGHVDDLTATGQSIWNNILDSETLKSGVDLINLLLTGLEGLTSSLGELGTLGVGIGGFTAIFNRDKSKQRFCPLWG